MPIPKQWPRSIVLTVLAAASAMGLAGCGASSSSLTSSTTSSTPIAGHAYGGQIFGGNQPISNAVIQMYSPGTNGYGTAAAPLLNRLVTTDANGYFSLANAFNLPFQFHAGLSGRYGRQPRALIEYKQCSPRHDGPAWHLRESDLEQLLCHQ